MLTSVRGFSLPENQDIAMLYLAAYIAGALTGAPIIVLLWFLFAPFRD